MLPGPFLVWSFFGTEEVLIILTLLSRVDWAGEKSNNTIHRVIHGRHVSKKTKLKLRAENNKLRKRRSTYGFPKKAGRDTLLAPLLIDHPS